MTQQLPQRMLWIDWMKVLGMFFIIWGHFFASGYVYIYVFSVQVFFLISGFLGKKEQSHNVFFQKTFHNLFIPAVLMSYIVYFASFFLFDGKYQIGYSLGDFTIGLITGNQDCLQRCWFIYTLIIIKFIFKFVPNKPKVHGGLFILFTMMAILIHQYGGKPHNAILSVCVSFQFYAIGYYLKKWKNSLNTLHHIVYELICLTASIIIVFLCGYINGGVWMFESSYGNYFSLYLIGGLAGGTMLFILCKRLAMIPIRKPIVILSQGMILILGFHYWLIDFFRPIVHRNAITSSIISIGITIAFIPIIQLAKRYVPILIGKR